MLQEILKDIEDLNLDMKKTPDRKYICIYYIFKKFLEEAEKSLQNSKSSKSTSNKKKRISKRNNGVHSKTTIVKQSSARSKNQKLYISYNLFHYLLYICRSPFLTQEFEKA